MKYYLLRKGSEFVIYRVKPHDVLTFAEKYVEQSLLEANTLMDMLVLFEQEYLFVMDWVNDAKY